MSLRRRKTIPLWLCILAASTSVHLMVPGVHGEPFSIFGIFRRSKDTKQLQTKTTNFTASPGTTTPRDVERPKKRARRIKAKRRIKDRQDDGGVRSTGGLLSMLAQLLPGGFPMAGRLSAVPPLLSPLLPASFANPAMQAAAALGYRYRPPMQMILPPLLPGVQHGRPLLAQQLLNSGLGRLQNNRQRPQQGGDASSPSSSGATPNSTKRPKVRYVRLKKKRFQPSELSPPSGSTTENAVSNNRRRVSTPSTEAPAGHEDRRTASWRKKKKKPVVPETSRGSSSTGTAPDPESPPSMASASGAVQAESAPSGTAAAATEPTAAVPISHSSPSDSSSSGSGYRKPSGEASSTVGDRRKSTPSRYQEYYDKYDSKTSQPSKTTSGYFKSKRHSSPSSSAAAGATSNAVAANEINHQTSNDKQSQKSSKTTTLGKNSTKKTIPDYTTTTVTGGVADKPKTFNHHHYYFDTTSTSAGDRDDPQSKESASSGTGVTSKAPTLQYSA